MTKIVDLQEYRTRVSEQRGFSRWHKRFGEAYGQATRLRDLTDKTLYLFEQVITRKDDLNDKYNPLSDQWGNYYEPVSRVTGVSGFDLTYTGRHKQNPHEADDWKEDWERSSKSPPTGLGLRLQLGKGTDAQTRSLYFRL